MPPSCKPRSEKQSPVKKRVLDYKKTFEKRPIKKQVLDYKKAFERIFDEDVKSIVREGERKPTEWFSNIKEWLILDIPPYT